MKVFGFCAIFLAALLLYIFTLNIDVQPADSGELQLAAYTLQIPHPPGYPLLTLLGWLVAQVPIASPFARLSFLSAVIAALAVAITYLTTHAILITASPPQPFSAPAKHLHALLPALAIAASTTFWAQATTFNVRSLTALFVALMAYAVAQSRQHPRQALWLMTGTIGLGVGHHASLVFVAALMGLFVLRRAVRAKLEWRAYASACAILVSTQIVWLLLPARDGAPGVLAHGNLRSVAGFLDHVLARGFGNDFFYFIWARPDQLWDRLAATPTLFLFQFSAPLLVAMGLGLVLLLMYQRGLGVLFIASIALHWWVTITYKAPQTIEYALPCWVLLGVGLGGWGYLPNVWRRWVADAGEGKPRPYAWVGAAVVGLIGVAIAAVAIRDGAQRWPSYRALAQDPRTRADAEGMLRYPNLNEQVFSEWHQATPMWALQVIDGIRPDVRVNYVAPAGAQPYEETFVERAAQSAQLGRTYITSHFPDPLATANLVSFPLSNTAGWRVDRQIDIASINFARTVWDERIILVHPLGLPKLVAVGQQINLDLWWSARGRHIEGDSITVRILFPDGRLAMNADVRLTGKEVAGLVSFKRVGFAIPWHLPPGRYALLAGAYNGAALYKTSQGQDFVPVGQLQVTPSAIAPISQHPYPFDTLRNSLIGVDYDLGLPNQMRVWTHWQLGPLTQTVVLRNSSDATLTEGIIPAQSSHSPQYISLAFDVPPQQGLHLEFAGESYDLPYVEEGSRYVPFADQLVLLGTASTRRASTLTVHLDWRAMQPISADYRISVRVYDDKTYLTHDGYPALGTIPTFKWIRNTEITDRHPFTLSSEGKDLKASVVVYNFTTRIDLIPLDERYGGSVGVEGFEI